MINAKSAEEIVRGRIDGIKARCEAATPGPWEWSEIACEFWYSDEKANAMGTVAAGTEGDGIAIDHCDADFIAHSREDIPYLLGLIESQAAEIAELRGRVDALEGITFWAQNRYLKSQLAERDKEIIKLKLEKELMRQEWDTAMCQLSASQQETRAAVEVLKSIKRDANEPDKIYIHLSHYFGRGPQEAGKENK